MVYDCAGRDDALRTVWLVAGQDADREMTVEAVRRVRFVPAGHGYPGYWQHKLTEARRVR